MARSGGPPPPTPAALNCRYPTYEQAINSVSESNMRETVVACSDVEDAGVVTVDENEFVSGVTCSHTRAIVDTSVFLPARRNELDSRRSLPALPRIPSDVSTPRRLVPTRRSAPRKSPVLSAVALRSAHRLVTQWLTTGGSSARARKNRRERLCAKRGIGGCKLFRAFGSGTSVRSFQINSPT